MYKHLLVLVLSQLLTISLPSIAGETTQLVYDTDGHKLSRNTSYYILPAGQKTGGFRLHMVLPFCMFFVDHMQRNDTAEPVQIKSSSDDGAIALSSNVTIRFHNFESRLCKEESMHWYVTDSSSVPYFERHENVVAAGKINDDDPQYIRPPSVFRIERFKDAMEGYKLVWCADEGPSKDLGTFAYRESDWLGASDSPLAVVFRKADKYVM
jgi:hypothetical protein